MKRFVTRSQCTYRCVVIPDTVITIVIDNGDESQCTYRCVVLPDVRDNSDNKG